jgi:hypothetical protein
LLTQFYGARQEKDEDISHWSCRLERIIGKCVDGGLVHHSEVDQQLHFMLWNGLKASLKAISGYKYDTIKDFDGMRVALLVVLVSMIGVVVLVSMIIVVVLVSMIGVMPC